MRDLVIPGLVQGLTEFLPVSSTALAALVLFGGDVRRLLGGWRASLTGRP